MLSVRRLMLVGVDVQHLCALIVVVELHNRGFFGITQVESTRIEMLSAASQRREAASDNEKRA